MTRALVVDDSRAMRMVLTRILTESGFDVLQAGDGRQALETIDREAGSIKLVLVDWNMPNLNGLDFVKCVRARPDLRGLLLLMVTTETEPEQMIRALNAGVDEYVMKPFTREALEDKLRLLGVLQ